MKNWKIPNNLSNDFQYLLLKISKLTQRAYFAGGFVRDIYLKRATNDVDIEIYDITPNTFDKLGTSLEAKGVGKSFFVYKYKNFDLSLPRVESKIAFGHRGFEVKVCNDTFEASKRRDFTINSMLLNIFTNELIDHFGGVEDLKNRVIKVVNPKTFIEDSLRVLRAIRFSSTFGFKIEPNSLKLFAQMSIDDLSKERIFKELEKFFNSTFLHYGVFYLAKLGLDEKLFGVKITRKEFFYIALNYKKLQNSLPKELHQFIFLYLLASVKNIKPTKLLSKLQAPNYYHQTLKHQLKRPKVVTTRFLAALSLKLELNNWLGFYGIELKGIDLSVKVLPKDVIADGFVKDGIKKEIRKRELKKLSTLRLQVLHDKRQSLV